MASILEELNTTHLLNDISIFDDSDYFRHIITLSAKNPNMTMKQRKSFGISIEDMLIRCSFNFVTCTPADFDWYFDEMYGSCFKFNAGKKSSGHSITDKISTKNGKEHGLYTELVVPNPLSNFSFSTSMELSVENKTAVPLFDEGFDVEVGKITNIAINRVFTKKAPKPFRNCVTNIEAYNSVFRNFFVAKKWTYRQSECFNYCYQRQLVATCDCYDTGFSRMTFNKTPCLSWSQLGCLKLMWETLFAEFADQNCTKDCPEECMRVSYSVSSSSSDFTTVNYMHVLFNTSELLRSLASKASSETEKYDILKKNVVAISAFYEHLSDTYIEERPKYTIIDTVSNVGGL
jgi:hypothetical protein